MANSTVRVFNIFGIPISVNASWILIYALITWSLAVGYFPNRLPGLEPVAYWGPHAGRGPKGYQRSDERIREDVCERLSENGDLDASEVEVLVVSREVTLQGSVPSRSHKRLAEDLVDSVSGVREVHNQLRVGQGMSGSQPGPSDWRTRAA